MTNQELHWVMLNRSFELGTAIVLLADQRGWLPTMWKFVNYQFAMAMTSYYVDWKVSQR